MKAKLELVIWRDAHFDYDGNSYPKEFLCQTAGWVSKDGKFLRIIGELTPGGPRSVTRVPMENIISRKLLRAVDE